MRVIYTDKGERAGLGKAGATVQDDGSGDQIRYALAHGYAVEGAVVADAAVKAPPVHSAVKKTSK